MKEYRAEAHRRLDVLAFYEAKVGPLRRINEQEYGFRCPFHDDTVASANVNVETGIWFCHVCLVGDSPLGLLMKQGQTLGEATIEIGARANMEPPSQYRNGAAGSHPPVANTPDPEARRAPAQRRVMKLPSDEKVAAWCEAAFAGPDLLAWLHDHRGFSDATIRLWQIGWDGERVTIPIRDADGTLVNVRRYLRGGDPSKKMIGVTGHNDAVLWPPGALAGDTAILVEGEWDAILLQQQGFPDALTVTSGAGIFRPEWLPLFEGKRVSVCYDNDDAGRRGARKVAGLLAQSAKEVSIVEIPGLPDKGDVTDFFVEQKRAADELRTLISDAIPFILGSPLPPIDEDALRLPLSEASDARHRGHLLAIPVLVSGKGPTPYTVPSNFTVSCDMDNKGMCVTCPLFALGGNVTIDLDARDERVLRLFKVPHAQQLTALKAMSEAPARCNHPEVRVNTSTNVEELRLIPELDTALERGDTEYVARTGLLLGHGIRSNRSYLVQGYTHPEPRTQETVHLLSSATPAQDNISAFEMAPELHESLKIFQPTISVEAKFQDIYEDFARSVHRIVGRFELQVSLDLAWHSVVAFYFNGAYVRRGWVETCVYGDSGSGKSECSLLLLGHYRMGERVQGEQASLAGLVGGLEKMGDSWILGWGKVPLNDRRLLIIDEAQGLKSGQIEAMSDVRATGVAEITKIRTERTNARCRLIWLANPKRPLGTYNQGVEALRDIFEKPEDIRRLDLVLAVKSGDVSLDEVNARHGQSAPARYDSDACRSLILWAWSRTPDQVHFTDEASKAILAAASDFGRRYHPSIPIVEPADQRLKLARLSAAVAARMFSTVDGEVLIVDAAHVEFVTAFLTRVYASPSLAYDEYSRQRLHGETLTDAERREVVGKIREFPHHEDLVQHLRSATFVNRPELEEQVGLTTTEAKDVIHALSGHRLLTKRREGYTKTPVFIELLRNLDSIPVVTTDEVDEAPF